ncbi:hypothetical protein [Caproicibacterium amylolyticum]|uniref:Uncharacterized protein n=1 Tax=Caproicibacterium amylolyticum TaxID=2766537 RepID=A0A7G9WJY6_9FIRM|nr:hypothetical protein [Caproicibacterium amylolyticum]QNO18998.1 hypothetical protein H6X83_05085 [Caproicibacterium amylolyticum]
MKEIYIPTSVLTVLLLILKMLAVPAIPWVVVFLPLIVVTAFFAVASVAMTIIIARYRDRFEKFLKDIGLTKADE